MAFWDSKRERSGVWIRKGGPGNKWTLADENGVMLDAPTGGAVDVNSRFGLDSKGQSVYLGALTQGDPARITANLNLRLDARKLLAQLALGACPFDIFVQQRCGDIAPLNYTAGIFYYDGYTTDKSMDNPLAQSADNTMPDVMRTLALSFAPIEDGLMPLTHKDLTASWSDFAFNKIISVGVPACVGDCETAENDGAQEFWAVTDQDSTPGYAATPAPMFKYTEDGGLNWSSVYIEDFLSADATDVVKVGDYVLVCSPTVGVVYAKFEDIKNGVNNPWTLASGIATQFPKALFAVGQDVYACGAAGYIWKSTDGGITWTVLSAGTITANALNSISFVDSMTGWFAGDSGTLVQYFNGNLSLVTVRTAVGGAAVTANFTVVETAEFRPEEVFLGTSTGLIYRTQNALGSYPLFTSMGFPLGGTGSINDLKFAGYKGSVLFIVQKSMDNTCRVLRDISGGALGNQTEIVGGFTTPGNFGINSIAPANINVAMTAGEVHETYAFIGKVLPK